MGSQSDTKVTQHFPRNHPSGVPLAGLASYLKYGFGLSSKRLMLKPTNKLNSRVCFVQTLLSCPGLLKVCPACMSCLKDGKKNTFFRACHEACSYLQCCDLPLNTGLFLLSPKATKISGKLGKGVLIWTLQVEAPPGVSSGLPAPSAKEDPTWRMAQPKRKKKTKQNRVERVTSGLRTAALNTEVLFSAAPRVRGARQDNRTKVKDG